MFDSDFVFGVSTASYQIEGSIDKDGKCKSIWDTFASKKGNIADKSDGKTVCDSYVKYKDTKFVMYETWAYERTYMGGEAKQREMMEQLRDAYVNVGTQIGASIARVGEAFFAYQTRSYVDGVETLPTLYAQNDVSHPSYYGAFLSACVHYVNLTGRSAKTNTFVPTEIEEQYVNIIKEIADEVMGIKN